MTCKICNSQTTRWNDAPSHQFYHHCQNCEALFLDEQFHLTISDEKKCYDNHRNSLENEGYVQMFESFLDFFWEAIKPNSLALEFGSGPTPVLTVLLEKRGVRVHGYDKVYQPELTYQNHCYDFITSTEVFEHLSDPKAVLLHVQEYLKPKGIVALMTLFHTNDEQQFVQWWYKRDKTHITFFTLKTITVLADTCGFDVIKSDGKRIAVLQKR